jgi:esterase/lipase superfamily enzyme
MTAGPAAVGPPLTQALTNVLGTTTPSWRLLCAAATILSFLATTAFVIAKIQDLPNRVAKAQTAYSRLEGLKTLLEITDIGTAKAVEQYTQVVHDLSFVPTHELDRERPEDNLSSKLPSWRVGSRAERRYAYENIRVFFATDRNRTSFRPTAVKFGGRRSKLRYGTCVVSIPEAHKIGELEGPSMWRLEFREVPWKHVVLLEAKVLKKADFFSEVCQRVKTSRKQHAFIFIHGYNVTFMDAARRTAQIAKDLNFDGAPVFYSWPSRGAIKAYPVNEQSIEWAETNVKNFFVEFLTRSEADNVYLIAHSMGNRAMARALSALMSERPDLKDRVTEIILTAPDIDADVFKRDIAPAFAKAGRPVTLYASSEDRALAASKSFHGYSRAGESGEHLVIAEGIETIDATGVDTSFLGHTHMSTRTVMSDIWYLVNDRKRAEMRFGLEPRNRAAGRYWCFKK